MDGIPQIRVERRLTISENSNFLLQGGILDGLTGEPPVYGYGRTAQAGEYSRQPGYAGRVAWSHTMFGQPLSFGAGGYYSKQNWGFGRQIDAWASTLDWNIPFGKLLGLSGEFYRGLALGGLGGGSYQSALFSGSPTDPNSRVRGLDSLGGWAQLKLRPSAKVEFNFAGGQDNPFASQIRAYPFSAYGTSGGHLPPVRNQSGLMNVISGQGRIWCCLPSTDIFPLSRSTTIDIPPTGSTWLWGYCSESSLFQFSCVVRQFPSRVDERASAGLRIGRACAGF